MSCPIQHLIWFIKDMIIKITVYPIKFVFFEFSKFLVVLVLAFWITVGIFSLWESIMPETARRLSAAAAALVANTSGLMPQKEDKDNVNEQGSYPFVVDIPNASSAMETKVNEDKLLEKESSSLKRPSVSTKKSQLEPAISGPLSKERSSSGKGNLPEPVPSQIDKEPEPTEIPKEEPQTEAVSPNDSQTTDNKAEASPKAPEQQEGAPAE